MDKRRIDFKNEQVSVSSILDKFLEIHRTHNIKLLSEIFAHDKDMVNYGSDADERFVGWEELEASFLKQFKSFEKTEVSYRKRVIKISESGLSAWYSEILDFDILVNGKPVVIHDFRHTGVLEKRDNSWIIVQFHYSVPVYGQAVEY